MGIFKKSKVKWDDIKGTESVYPDKSLSLFTFLIEEEMQSGWVDLGYKDYAFKKKAKANILIEVRDINDDSIDIGAIEDFFEKEIRSVGIGHVVGRIQKKDGIDIEFYSNMFKELDDFLDGIKDKNPNFKFKHTIAYDPFWFAYRGITKFAK